MKILPVCLFATLTGGVWAEQIGEKSDRGTPETPTAFETRNEGGNTEGSVSISRNDQGTAARKITLIAVCDVRDWRNTEGTVIRASMLAYDQDPKQPDKLPLTLVSDGKIRLMVEGRNQFSEYPLSKLSPEDRAFVDGLIRARKAAAVEAAKKQATGTP